MLNPPFRFSFTAFNLALVLDGFMFWVGFDWFLSGIFWLKFESSAGSLGSAIYCGYGLFD